MPGKTANFGIIICLLILSLLVVACGDSATPTAAPITTVAATTTAAATTATTMAVPTTLAATTTAAVTTTRASSTTTDAATLLKNGLDAPQALVDSFTKGFVGSMKGTKPDDLKIELKGYAEDPATLAQAANTVILAAGYKPYPTTDLTQSGQDGAYLGLFTKDGAPDNYVYIGSTNSKVFAAMANLVSKDTKTIVASISGTGLIGALRGSAASTTPGAVLRTEASPVKIVGVALATDKDGKNVVKSFTPETNPLYCIVQLESPPVGTRVKATWIAVDVVGAANTQIVDAETTYTDTSVTPVFIFNATLPRNWPTGKYKVQLFINGSLVQEVPFTVQ